MGRKAGLEMAPRAPGEGKETYADIWAMEQDFGFKPETTIDDGIPRFVDWYRDYHRV